MMLQQQILDFYTRLAAMTSGRGHAPMLDKLQGDMVTFVRVVQGLLLHEHLAAPAYGLELSDERRGESHIRPVEQMLDHLLAHDGRPLSTARPAGR